MILSKLFNKIIKKRKSDLSREEADAHITYFMKTICNINKRTTRIENIEKIIEQNEKNNK